MIKNPNPPGKLVKSMLLDPLELSVTDAAKLLKVSRPTLSKLVNGHMAISPEMSLRLAIVFNSSEELWLNLQTQYDLWKARKDKARLKLKPLNWSKAA